MATSSPTQWFVRGALSIALTISGAGVGAYAVPAAADDQLGSAAASVPAAEAGSSDSPTQARGDVAAGVKIGKVSISKNRKRVNAAIEWDHASLRYDRKHTHRFSIRLIGKSKKSAPTPTVLVERSRKAAPRKVQIVKLRLTNKQARALRTAKFVVVAASQHERVGKQKRFSRSWVSARIIRDKQQRSTAAVQANATGCATRVIRSAASVSGCYLAGANLSALRIRNADFDRSVLANVTLRGSNLAKTRLTNTSLLGADLSNANLAKVDFRGSVIRGSKLRGSNLRGANFTGVSFAGVDLTGVDLTGAIGVDLGATVQMGIVSVTPNLGSVNGGDTITIGGQGFSSKTTVTVGGNPCTIVGTPSGGQVQCVTNAHAAGIVDIVVTDPNASNSPLTQANAFTYQSQGFLYYSGTAPAGATTIGRMALDGTGANDKFIQSTQCQAYGPMAIVGRYLYFASVNNKREFGTIGRAFLDGSQVNCVYLKAPLYAGGDTNWNVITSMAGIDNTLVWSSMYEKPSPNVPNELYYAAVGDGPATPIMFCPANGPAYPAVPTTGTGLSANSSALWMRGYQSQSGATANFPAGAFTTTGGCFRTESPGSVSGDMGPGQPLSVNDSFVYYTNINDNGVHRQDFWGNGDIQVIPASTPNLTGQIANDGSSIYAVAQPSGGGAASILRAKADGSQLASLASVTPTAVGSAGGGYLRLMATPGLAPAPQISSFSPTSGFTSGGTVLTIEGANFAFGATVTIGGEECSTLSVQPTQITCTLPVHARGDTTIVVKNLDTQWDQSVDTYHFAPSQPTVTAAHPNQGPATGSAPVTLWGTGFDPGATVTVGGVACTGVEVEDDHGNSAIAGTRLTCTTGASEPSNGPVDVVVTNPEAAPSVPAAVYTYLGPPPVLNSVAPATGPVAGGTALALTGTGFVPNGPNVSTVAVSSETTGVQPCALTGVQSETTLVCKTPSHLAGEVSVIVTNSDGQSATLNNAYTFLNPAPTLSSASPMVGTTGGGDVLTLAGTNFNSGTTVTIADTPCAVDESSLSSTSLKCTTGFSAAATAPIVVKNSDGQQASSTLQYTYQVTQPVITSISPNALPFTMAVGAMAADQLTIYGRGLDPAATVSVGGLTCTPTWNGHTNNSMVCVMSSEGAPSTPVDVTVTNPGGLQAVYANSFVFGKAPLISAATGGDLGWIRREAGGEADAPLVIGDTIGDIVDVGFKQYLLVEDKTPPHGNTGISVYSVSPYDSSEVTLVITNLPATTSAIAVVNENLYWLYTTTGSGKTNVHQQRANLMNSPATIDNSFNPAQVQLTGTSWSVQDTWTEVVADQMPAYELVLWSAVNGDAATGGSPNTVLYETTSLSGFSSEVMSSTATAAGMATGIDGEDLYLLAANTAGGGELQQFDLQQSRTTPAATLPLTNLPIGGMTFDQNYLYWANANTSSGSATTTNVGRVTLTGQELNETWSTLGQLQNYDPQAPAPATLAADPTILNPVVSGVSPATGLTTGTTQIEIAGQNLQTATLVTVGGMGCPIVSKSFAAITCTAQPHAAGPVDVSVVLSDMQSGTASQAFTYLAPAPVAATISPTSGPTTGNQPVTVSGSNFQPGDYVTLGGVPCRTVSLTDDQIQCTSGVDGPGVVDVTVWRCVDGPSQPCTNESTLVGGYTYDAVGALYWANSGNATIGHSALDGTNPNGAFIDTSVPAGSGNSAPSGVATDNNYVYWTDSCQGTDCVAAVGRARLDGTDPDPAFITWPQTTETNYQPQGLAITDDYIFWANTGTNTIGCAKIDGSGANQSFITGALGPFGMATDGTNIYWANSAGATAGTSGSTIGKADISSMTDCQSNQVSGITQSFITGAAAPSGVAVDSTYIYWTNFTTGTVGRATLADPATTTNQSFVTGATQPDGVTVNAGNIYWANSTINSLGQTNLTATDPANQNFVVAASSPIGIAVSGN